MTTQPIKPAACTPARWRRKRPLPHCPDLGCKRQGRCLGLALGGNCMKTFHTDPDGWAGEMAEDLNAYLEKCEREEPGSVLKPEEVDPNDYSWQRVWKQLLEERIAREKATQAGTLAKSAPSRKTRRK